MYKDVVTCLDKQAKKHPEMQFQVMWHISCSTEASLSHPANIKQSERQQSSLL